LLECGKIVLGEGDDECLKRYVLGGAGGCHDDLAAIERTIGGNTSAMCCHGGGGDVADEAEVE
jgi:hypothetical protein